MEQLKDYITGKEINMIGSEVSRQIFEQFLVNTKGYDTTDIQVDVPIVVQFKGEDYYSTIDLIVFCQDKALMAVTCVAGSINSYERGILSGARLIHEYQIPLAISTDARDAVVLDTLTGKTIGKGLNAVPSKRESEDMLSSLQYIPLNPDRKEGEMIIYRSFNLERVHY